MRFFAQAGRQILVPQLAPLVVSRLQVYGMRSVCAGIRKGLPDQNHAAAGLKCHNLLKNLSVVDVSKNLKARACVNEYDWIGTCLPKLRQRSPVMNRQRIKLWT